VLREEIPYTSRLKETLSEYGYAVEDTSKIPRILREIKACGGNAKVLLKRAEVAKDLRWEIINLKDEKERLEPVVKYIEDEGLKLQEDCDQLQDKVKGLEATKQGLEKEIEGLDAEASRKSNDLRMVNCLTSILMSKPSDIDVLYNYVYWLKQINIGAAPELLQRKPYYEETVKKQIVNTLVEYLKEEMAPREEVIKLQKDLQNKNQQNSTLLTKTASLERAKSELLAITPSSKRR